MKHCSWCGDEFTILVSINNGEEEICEHCEERSTHCPRCNRVIAEEYTILSMCQFCIDDLY